MTNLVKKKCDYYHLCEGGFEMLLHANADFW